MAVTIFSHRIKWVGWNGSIKSEDLEEALSPHLINLVIIEKRFIVVSNVTGACCSYATNGFDISTDFVCNRYTTSRIILYSTQDFLNRYVPRASCIQ